MGGRGFPESKATARRAVFDSHDEGQILLCVGMGCRTPGESYE
jgi:hypothetical protein